jgi:hypothetical protein
MSIMRSRLVAFLTPFRKNLIGKQQNKDPKAEAADDKPEPE